MKKYQIILLATLFFVVIFYDEYFALNFGLFGLFNAVFAWYLAPEKNKTRLFITLFVCTILSSFAFIWFNDGPSFIAIISSLLLLNLKAKARNLKPLMVIPIAVTNACTFICRVFDFDKWLPKSNEGKSWQQMIAVVLIPFVFLSLFFVIYTYGSDHFANLFVDWEWNFNFLHFFALLILGFFLAFNYWNFVVLRSIYESNSYLNNDFDAKLISNKPSFSFLSLDFERLSGVVTFFALSILLVIFIFTFNYEQFGERMNDSTLSEETHERVAAVIMSIAMAIVVIMFYFKSGFNFDSNAKLLKIAAYVWILLNAILVISTMVKNTEYVYHFGLTYKRLGVYAFLTLSLLGLAFTWYKISAKKTNVFLFNTMIWSVYGMILVCSWLNWGGIITQYNLKQSHFDLNYLLNEVHLNEKDLLDYAKKHDNKSLENEVVHKIKSKQRSQFLSKVLYYETVRFQEHSK